MEKLLILFGQPGSGKSYVAQLLKNNYGFTVFNGDRVIPPDMKKALFANQIISEDMRQRFSKAMLVKLHELTTQTHKLVFMQTLLKDDLRREIHKLYPEGILILVRTNKSLREKRYLKRQKFNLGLNYLRQTSQLFEKPTVPFVTIQNNLEGSDNIIKQLEGI